MGKFQILRFPSATVTSVLIFIFSFLSFILFLFLVALLRQYVKQRKLRTLFFKEALEVGLTLEQASVLWIYSEKFGRDPFLTLEFKAPFEKVVDLYLNTDPDPDEELVSNMRKKLGFDFIPYFVPLTSSKDIELFQAGKVYLPDNTSSDVALFDKDERFMYWAVVNGLPSTSFKVGETVKISFVRKSDAVYSLEGQIVDTHYDNNKLILKLPHTFELTRYQRREHTRVETDISASMGTFDSQTGEIVWYPVKIVDISVGGAKVCLPFGERLNVRPMEDVIVNFKLKGREFSLRSVVVNIYERKTSVCYGIRFEKAKEEERKLIFDFVKEQQQKLAAILLRKS